MALVKQEVAENKLTSAEDIQNVVDQACEQLDIQLSEENQQQIAAFLQRHPEFAVCAPDAPLPAGMTAGEYGCLSVPTRTGMDGFFLCVLQKAAATQ